MDSIGNAVAGYLGAAGGARSSKGRKRGAISLLVTRGFLLRGEYLVPGQSLISPCGRVSLTFRFDGNLVLERGSTVIWVLRDESNPQYAGRLWFRADGNLHVLDDGRSVTYDFGVTGGERLDVNGNGTVTVRTLKGVVLWSRGVTEVPAVRSSYLSRGESLAGGSELTSPSGEYKLRMMESGGFSIFKREGGAFDCIIFDNGSKDVVPTQLTLNEDGSLVVVRVSSGLQIWNSNTSGKLQRFELRDDGQAVLVDFEGIVVWRTGSLYDGLLTDDWTEIATEQDVFYFPYGVPVDIAYGVSLSVGNVAVKFGREGRVEYSDSEIDEGGMIQGRKIGWVRRAVRPWVFNLDPNLAGSRLTGTNLNGEGLLETGMVDPNYSGLRDGETFQVISLFHPSGQAGTGWVGPSGFPTAGSYSYSTCFSIPMGVVLGDVRASLSWELSLQNVGVYNEGSMVLTLNGVDVPIVNEGGRVWTAEVSQPLFNRNENNLVFQWDAHDGVFGTGTFRVTSFDLIRI